MPKVKNEWNSASTPSYDFIFINAFSSSGCEVSVSHVGENFRRNAVKVCRCMPKFWLNIVSVRRQNVSVLSLCASAGLGDVTVENMKTELRFVGGRDKKISKNLGPGRVIWKQVSY